MNRYELREQGHVFATIEADDTDAALATLDGELNYADYSDDADESQSLFIEIAAVNVDDADDSATRTFIVDPREPDCTDDDGHDWQEPHAIVGGIESNPGVWGHGGGVTIDECCMHCGCRKHTDTWATDPSNGTQGHRTIAYTPGHYLAEVVELREEEDES